MRENMPRMSHWIAKVESRAVITEAKIWYNLEPSRNDDKVSHKTSIDLRKQSFLTKQLNYNLGLKI
jgi:hypothetical protein